MPQLIPFYYFNEVLWTFLIIYVLLYILSKYILPQYTLISISRLRLENPVRK